MSDERTADYIEDYLPHAAALLDIPVERLRADLAIAKRARETRERPEYSFDGGMSAIARGWNDCRDHILGSTT